LIERSNHRPSIYNTIYFIWLNDGFHYSKLRLEVAKILFGKVMHYVFYRTWFVTPILI